MQGVRAGLAYTNMHLQILSLHVLREALRDCEANLAWINDLRAHTAVSNVIISGMMMCVNFGESPIAYDWGHGNDWFRVTGDFYGSIGSNNNNVAVSLDSRNKNSTAEAPTVPATGAQQQAAWTGIPARERWSQ